MSTPYLGEIRMVAFNFAPTGWQQCYGQIMSIAQNQALFALLGTVYGGNGVTTFGLPDLRGRSAVGMGQGPGLSNIDIGQISGTENVSLTINNMPAHTHAAAVTGGLSVTGNVAIPATTSTTGEAGTPANNTVLGTASAGGRPVNLYSTAAPNATLAPFAVTLTGPSPSITNSVTGGSQPFAIRNPYLGMNFIIAVEGIFPSRG
jgi:microcystin-dependent protein